MAEEKLLNIWVLVGSILILYGAIITGCGVYYAYNGTPNTVLGETNPSLWWGIVMFGSGILLLSAGKKK